MKKQTKQEAELLRRKAEELIKKQPLKSSSQYSETDMFKLLHELEVHQIELEMQNEELRLAKEHTEASAEKYTELYDFAPSGYFTISKKGEILELNIIGSQILGKERSYLINKPFGLFVTDNAKPIFNQFFKKIFENRTEENCKIIIKRKDNQYTHIYLSGKVSKNGEQCLLTATDISELIKEQTKLLESEERFRVASLATGFGAFSFNFDSGEAYYSEGFLNLYGLYAGKSIELENNLVAKALHPDDKKRFFLAMQEANNPCGSGILDIEFRIIHKDGGIRWLHSQGLTIFTGNKSSDRPIYANGILQDITEEKNADLALFASESKYRKLHESIRDAFVSVNMKGEIIDCNQVYIEMLGYSETEIKKMTYFDLTPAEWHSFEAKIVEEEILPKGFSGVYEKEYRKKDGSVFPVELRTYLIKDNDGNPSLLWAIVRDITERKQADERLRLSEEKFRLLFKAIPVPTYIWKSIGDDFILIDGNNIAESFTQGAISNFIGVKASIMYRDNTLILNEIKECYKTKTAIEREMEYTLKSTGERKFLFVKYAYVTPDFVLVHTVDFTERKHIEDELRKSNEKYYNLYYYATLGVFRSTFDGRFIDMNPSLAKMLGYDSPTEAVSCISSIPNQIYAKPQIHSEVAASVLNSGGEITTDNHYLRKNGESWYGRLHLRLAKDNQGNPSHYEGFIEDITERFQSELKLFETQQLINAIVESTNDFIWSVDPEKFGLLTFNSRLSNNFLNATGIHIKAGMTPRDLYPTNDFVEAWANLYKRALLEGSSKTEYVGKTGAHVMELNFNLIKNDDETIRGISVFGRDITERKLAEDNLRTSEQRLRVGLNTSNIAIFNQDLNLCYTWMYQPQLGYTSDQVVGRTDDELLPPDAAKQVMRIKQHVLDSGEKENAEVIVNVGNQRSVYNLLVEPLRDKSGIIIGLTGATLDITERKKVEEELQKSEEKWRLLVSNSPDYIALHDRGGRYLFLNRYAEGFSEKDVIGKLALDFLSIESKDVYKTAFEKCVQTLTKQEIEYKALGANSEMKFYESTFVPINSSGDEVNVLVVAKDITDRKQAEKILNDLIDKNPISIQIMDKDGFTLKVNSSHSSLFGSPPPPNFSIFEDLKSKGYGDYILQAQKGEVVHFPDIYYNVHDVFPNLPDKPAWIRAVLFPLADPRGIAERFVFMHEDITMQKEAEDTLRKNNSRLELAMQIANMSWWEMDIKTGNVKFNKRKAEMLGYPPEQFKHYKDFMALVHPDDYENCMNAMRNHLNGQANSYEAMYRMQSKSGFYKWFLDIGTIVEKDSNGAPLTVTGIVIDVNNRKLTEDALHESHEFNSQIINGVQEGVVVYDCNLVYKVWNPYMEKLTGMSSSEVLGKKPMDVFPFLVDVGIVKNLEKALNGETTKSNDFSYNVSSKGKTGWASDISSPLYNFKGEIIGVIGNIRDITERKKAEIETFQTLKLFYSIFNLSPNAIVLSKLSDGRYIQVNNRFLQLTKYSHNEVIGHTSIEFGLVKDPVVREKKLKILQNGEKLTNVEVDIFTKSGEIRHCLVSSEPVTVDHEKYILSNYHDFTERKKIENENKEIKEALENLNRHLVEIRENERASIAREIHDQLGQSLTALKIDLKWLHDKKGSDSELSHKLKGMIDLTSETIKDVQRITSELRPSILDDIGLSAAIEWYCVEFSKRTGLQMHLEINDVQTENVQINLSVYRILQESLTNVIRHSGAKNVIVSLSIIEKNLVLLIQDDGIGISQDQVNSLKSFGIRGMIERVKQSGGLMEIASLDNGGTFVGVHIPLK